jgi:5-methylcytosine-specific restriction protein A
MPKRSKVHNPWPAHIAKQMAQARGRVERRDDPLRELYKLPEWRDERIGIRACRLMMEQLCRRCAERGVTTLATEVDHIVPHRGDVNLFMSIDNTQSLCKSCHSKKTVREKRG